MTIKELCIGQNLDGRLEVFAIGCESCIYHNWQTAPNNGWRGESRLGTADNKAIAIAVGRNQDGRLAQSAGFRIRHPLTCRIGANTEVMSVFAVTRGESVASVAGVLHRRPVLGLADLLPGGRGRVY